MYLRSTEVDGGDGGDLAEDEDLAEPGHARADRDRGGRGDGDAEEGARAPGGGGRGGRPARATRRR